MANDAVVGTFVPTTAFTQVMHSLKDKALKERFPETDPDVEPLGWNVLVQIMLPKEMTDGGVWIPEDTQDANADTTQVAKVIAAGPLAFKSRNNGAQWPEGSWVSTGDFVRVPRYGGDRFKVKSGTKNVQFAFVRDLDLIARLTGDPTKVISYCA
jgi:co-chaperonin GroES (HSP10)